MIGIRAVAAAALSVAASSAAALTAPVSPADLLRVADFAGLSASPDGRSVVFRIERADLSSNSYPASWYALTAEGSARPIGSGGEVIYVDPGVPSHEAPVWSPGSDAIFFRALVGSEVQLWRARLDGSAAAPVLVDDADILSLSPAPDGQGLIFVIGPSRAAIRRAERDEYDSGILVDEHVDLAQNVFRGGIINGRRATQRLTGVWFARDGLLWRGPRLSRYLDFATLEVRDREPAGAASTGSPARRDEARATSRSGDQATASSGDGDPGIEVRRRDGGSLFCRVGACRDRISWLAWGRNADELVFASQDVARAQSIHVWDLAGGGVRLLARSDGLLSGGREPGVPCVVAIAALFCTPATAASPPRLERIELDSGARTIAFDPNAELRGRLRLRVEHLRWRGDEGHDFTGVLLSAPGPYDRPRPLFVNYYLCEGFLRGGLGDEWPLASLAAAGIDALCITSTILPGPQDALANNRAAAEGIRTIVMRLGREGRTDTRRVGMGGLSFGSEVTLWLAFNTRLLAAASIASPGLEPAYYWFNGVRGRDNHEILEAAWGLRAPDETPERWNRLSAALNADRITAPLLMQLPEQEARFVVELHARLSLSPTPVELHVFPDEPHIKVQPRHKLAAYRRNLDWFRYWLLGERDPDSLKRAQYERWDRLRARRDSLISTPTSAATARASRDRRSGSSGDRSAPAPAEGRTRRSPDR